MKSSTQAIEMAELTHKTIAARMATYKALLRIAENQDRPLTSVLAEAVRDLETKYGLAQPDAA